MALAHGNWAVGPLSGAKRQTTSHCLIVESLMLASGAKGEFHNEALRQ
jgi:hypothetical protein